MCPPIGLRIVASTATMRKLRIVIIDAKGGFIQTGPAEREVYVIPPYESKHIFYDCYWRKLSMDS